MSEMIKADNTASLALRRAQNSLVTGNVENQKYLTFDVRSKCYGVGINSIKEIIEYPTVTRIPLTASFIRGVINLRGNVVPVVDLALRLDKDSRGVSRRTCVIIVEQISDGERMDLGFVVDSVNAVIDLPATEIRQAPDFGVDIRPEFISGMGKVDDDFVIILNLNRVLSVSELAQLAVEC